MVCVFLLAKVMGYWAALGVALIVSFLVMPSRRRLLVRFTNRLAKPS